jgi:sigma-B regulation protein RsbU (phosphoserine phosphatase)
LIPLTDNVQLSPVERRLLDELDKIVTPFARAANASVGYTSGAWTSWLTTCQECLCSQNEADHPLSSERSCQQGRTCYPIEFRQGAIPKGRLIVCCKHGETELPAALEQLVTSINRQIELEQQEELLLDELSASWESLEAVYEISSDLGLVVKPQELLERILNRAASYRTGLKAILWLERDGMCHPLAKGLAEPGPRPKEGGLIGKVMAERNGMIINGRARIVAQRDLESEFQRASNLALVPLTSTHSSLGALAVWQDEELGDFDSHDMRFLAALALQAAMVVENDRLHRAALESERLRQEVEIGSKIQQTLLHGQIPRDCPGVKVAALSIPSQMIDGDFYDFIIPDAQCLDVISGDVMGKGIPAALVGAATKSSFLRAMSHLLSTSTRRRLPEPHEIVMFVHTDVVKRLINLESFVTLCYARFDLAERQAHIVDCGHTMTVHYRRSADACDLLKGVNMPIGFREREIYEQFSCALEAGDLFFFYSDGLTETTNAAGEAFGEERLVELIRRNSMLDPEPLVAEVHRTLIAFAGSETLHDDLTCVAVRILEIARPNLAQSAELKFLSHPRNLEQCRAFVRQACHKAAHPAVDEEFISQLELAVNEAVANVMEHAYQERDDQPIQLTAEVGADRIAIRIYHKGASFDPASVPEPFFDGSKDGGFGLFIIAHLVDDITYACNELGVNSITLVKIFDGGNRYGSNA